MEQNTKPKTWTQVEGRLQIQKDYFLWSTEKLVGEFAHCEILMCILWYLTEIGQRMGNIAVKHDTLTQDLLKDQQVWFIVKPFF